MGSYFEPDRGWRYDFQKFGRRYRAPRALRTKKQSEDAERALRDRIDAIAAGVVLPTTAPRFSTWAGVTYQFAVDRLELDDPETFERNLRVVLRFWGAKPSDPAKVRAREPYHDLTLDAPLRDGTWLLKFEQWMAKKKLAGSTRNHYRSACSRMFFVAMQPEYQAKTGITRNPFVGILRDRTRKRNTTYTAEQLRAILTHAEPALRMAIHIALRAPKFRLGNIVELQWKEHFDEALAWITITRHKTGRRTQQPLVAAVPQRLKTILEAHRKTQPKKATWVVGDGVTPVTKRQIQLALQRACTAAGVPYGMGDGEATFHTFRHTAATTLAELDVAESKRKNVMGQKSIQTTQGYTHLRPVHEMGAATQLDDEITRLLDAGGNPGEPPTGSPGTTRHKTTRRARVLTLVKSA